MKQDVKEPTLSRSEALTDKLHDLSQDEKAELAYIETLAQEIERLKIIHYDAMERRKGIRRDMRQIRKELGLKFAWSTLDDVTK